VAPAQGIAIDQLGCLGNALVITYAIARYRLLDIKLVLRKSLVYGGITGITAILFMSVFFTISYGLGISWTTPAGLAIVIGLAILMAAMSNPLRSILENGADKLFYGSKYDFRKMVLTFAGRMSNIMGIEELAEAMLRPITQAVGARQASLLFVNNAYFRSQFAVRLAGEEPVTPIELRQHGLIVKHLDNENGPLYRESIDIEPKFKGVWQEERDTLDAAQVDVLLPIKTKHKLIAILAVSKKYRRGSYGSDDIDLLMTLASEAAVVIENAQIYDRARQRANTDELTGLFNHRHFHERLDEEIARSARFGKVFSLLFMDVDRFKNYNDAYGHLVGDEVLKQLGRVIDESVRNIDICFRYGGDEFAVLLPETPLKGASQVATRIRKAVETQTELKGIPQTSSIGVASWPTDGVMREEIIRAADAALYYAKQLGTNKVVLACEVALADIYRIDAMYDPQNRDAVLNTIYALAATVDAKDHHTYGHSKKVSKYAMQIAEAYGHSLEETERIRRAALLHDIGKIGVSDKLLTKSGPLASSEWDMMRSHPSLGVSILKHVDSLNDCLAAVQYHHERYDGKGYPSGLKGENIPVDARILTVADSYDAMTSERPYRLSKAIKEEALDELRRCSGTQFDPTFVDIFVNLMTQESEIALETH
jgi:diguanylate cyclase (GGDEF)-like protein/putative nucleotidyltransferase with HDIG domain